MDEYIYADAYYEIEAEHIEPDGTRTVLAKDTDSGDWVILYDYQEDDDPSSLDQTVRYRDYESYYGSIGEAVTAWSSLGYGM